MLFQVAVCVSLLIITLHGKELDPGPQVFPVINSTASQSSNKRYETKDVIVYLTATQINDLESGKAELRATSVDQITINKLPEDQPKQQDSKNSYHVENLSILKAPLIPNPSLQRDHKLRDQKSDKQLPEKQSNGLSKSNLFDPEQQVIQNDRQISELWTPISATPEKNQEALSQEQFNKNWQKVLQKNREQLKLISDYQHELPLKEFSTDTDQLTSRGEAARFDLPLIIHKEVKITKHQPIVKHVNVPIPTPVLLSLPEPYEVRVPHPYPVPLQFIKHIPVQLNAGKEKTYDALRNPVGSVFINVNHPY